MAGEAKPLTAEREVEIRAWLEPQAGWVTQQQWLALAPVIVIDLLAEIDRLRSDCAAAREAALREAAAVLAHPNAGLVSPDGGDPTPREMLDNCRDAILALINTPPAGAEGGRDGG